MAMWSDMPRIAAPPNTKDLDVLTNYVKNLADVTARMAKDLEFIINGNVDSKNIRAESIETRNLKANSITTDKINAGAVIAEKIDVKELSAISANLGHIVAGLIESIEIYGSYIATRQNGYPRCEMSNEDNLFGAHSGPGRYINMVASGGQGTPQMTFADGSTVVPIFLYGGTFYIGAAGQSDVMVVGRDIRLRPSGKIVVKNWDDIYSEDDNQTLREALGK